MHPDHQPPAISPAEESQRESQKRFSSFPKSVQKFLSVFGFLINWLVIPALVFFTLHNFIFQPFHVIGHSMNPTLQESDYLIVSKVDKTIAGFERHIYIPKRGQVVVFHYPKDPTLVFVKRVIGLPGERVVIKDGGVRVYNAAHPEGFNPDDGTYQLSDKTTLGNFDEVVPNGSIFVLGDNRAPNGSFDSREWGTLPSSYIVGTASMRLLPFTQIRTFATLPAFQP